MLNSTSTMVVWCALHLVLWGATLFMASVTGGDSGCDVVTVLCGTPVESFVTAGRQIPNLGLLGVVTLVPNMVTAVWGLMSVNYEIIQGGGLITSLPGWILRIIAAAAGLRTIWGAISNLLNAVRS